jgi:hypothetical protein
MRHAGVCVCVKIKHGQKKIFQENKKQNSNKKELKK